MVLAKDRFPCDIVVFSLRLVQRRIFFPSKLHPRIIIINDSTTDILNDVNTKIKRLEL